MKKSRIYTITAWNGKNEINAKICMFSALKDDSSIDKLKPKRIRIYDELLTSPLSDSDFEGRMVIFDVIQSKEHKKSVQKILMETLQVGRLLYVQPFACWR